MIGPNYFGGQQRQDHSWIGESETCRLSAALEFCSDAFQLPSPCRQCHPSDVAVQVAGCHLECSEQKTKAVTLSLECLNWRLLWSQNYRAHLIISFSLVPIFMAYRRLKLSLFVRIFNICYPMVSLCPNLHL